MKFKLPNIDWEAIYVWFIALFFFVNALSAMGKTTPVLEIAFLIFYAGLLVAVKKFPRLADILLDKKILMPAGFMVLVAYFFISFPIKDINSIPFHEDFIQFYTLSMQGINILRHGSLFGWNSGLLGGYYTAFDIVSNKSLFLLPFTIFGGRIGFHLMLLAFLLAFPALTYILVSLKTEDRTTRNAALLLSIPFALYYFRNPLHTGTIDTFMAAPLLILTLIAVELMYKKTRFATFLLTVSLALTFYAHIGIFVLSGAFIALELFTRPEKEKYLPRFIAAAVFTFLLTINFSYFFLSNLHCFSVSNSTFEPLKMTASSFYVWLGFLFADVKRMLLLNFAPHELNGLAFILIPVIFFFEKYYRNDRNPKRYYWCMIVCFVFVYMGRSMFTLIFQSAGHVMEIFLTLTLAYWLTMVMRNHKLLAVSILICIPVVITPQMNVFPHIKDLGSFDRELVSRINKMDGNMILLEARDTWELVADPLKQSEKDPLRIHAESLFPMETGKDFFTYYTAGYSHSPFKGNNIDSGTYQGRLITDYPVATFDKLIKKWGIRYLILWSGTSKDYFGRYHSRYKMTWHDANWTVYRADNNDIRSVVAPHGSGIMVNQDPFGKTVKLSNVRKGDEIVLRSDFMRQWKGYYNGRPVPLYEKDGQIAFKAPREGAYDLTLKFPKYGLLTAISLCSLLAMFLLSRVNLL